MIEVVSSQAAKNNLNFYLNTTFPFQSDYKNLKLKTSAGFLVFYRDCMDGIASSAIFNSRGARIFNCSTENVIFHPMNPSIDINYQVLMDKIKDKLKVKNLYPIFLDFSVSKHKELAKLNLVPFITIDHNSCALGGKNCYIQVVNESFDSCANLLADIFQVPHSEENQENVNKLITATNWIEGCGLSMSGKIPDKEIMDNIYESITTVPGSFSTYLSSKKMKSSHVLRATYNFITDEFSEDNEKAGKEMIDFNKKAWQYEPKIDLEYNIANGVKVGAVVFKDDQCNRIFRRITMLKAFSLPYDILLIAYETEPKKRYEITVMSKIPCNIGLFCDNNMGFCITNRIGVFSVGTTSIMKKLNLIVDELKSYMLINGA